MTRPIAVDLFAGVGGMSLGFEQAGFDVVAAAEYDPVHAACHAFNFPLAEVLCRAVQGLTADDVRSAARRGVAKHRGDAKGWDGHINVVFGGPSCQGFSVMGRRSPEDERNSLLVSFCELATELAPEIICIENVPGMLEPRFEELRGRAFEVLTRSGYSVSEPTILDASQFGVPQHRRRVFIVATKGIHTSFHLSGAGAGAPVTVEEALSGLPQVDGFSELLLRDVSKARVAVTRARESAEGGYARTLCGRISDPSDHGHTRLWDPSTITNSLLTRHSEETVRRFARTQQGKTEAVSRSFRLDPSRPARTLRAGTGSERGAFSAPRPIHPIAHRLVTAREAARLHSFPDWFRFNGTNWHSHRQIGNSVPPLLARAVARDLLRMLGTSSAQTRQTIALGDARLLYLPKSKAAVEFAARPAEIPAARRRVPRSAA